MENRRLRPSFLPQGDGSDVFATVWAEDIILASQEASAHQRLGALVAIEAVVVPLALLECDVLAAAKTTNRGGAGCTFLRKQVAEAVQAVGEVIPGGEALASELLLASSADETRLMPGLVAIIHTSSEDGLFAVAARKSKLLLIAGQAVLVGILLDEAPGADGLLAAVASETILMPSVALVLHFFGTWHDRRLARVALGGVLVDVAIGAHQQLVFGGERLIHQRSAAFDAEEAFTVPVTVLVRQVLAGAADELVANIAVAGKQLLVALDAVGTVLLQDVLLPKQGLFAVDAVVRIQHVQHGHSAISVNPVLLIQRRSACL